MRSQKFKLGFRGGFIAAVALLLAAAQTPTLRAQEKELFVSEREFKQLLEELAPKVNLFKKAWEIDPAAEMYGGTSRDFAYWVIRQFRDVKSESDARNVIAGLRKLPLIDVREFILPESDVDLITAKGHLQIDPNDFGVRKVDRLSPDILNPAAELGYNEVHQGYIPVEKIRITKDGIKSHPHFKDALAEILSGKITVQFAPETEFWATKYAKAGENHPVLLALRYIRTLSVNYYQRYGTEYVKPVEVDAKSDEAMKAVMESVKKPHALDAYLKHPRFVTWLNASVDKSFRAYANPTAAMALFKRYKIDELVLVYPEIASFNSYVFYKRWDPKVIAGNFRQYGAAPGEVYTDPKNYFPDLQIYHGTRTDEAYRNILFQGILPSQNGSAGEGLYAVAKGNVQFAIDWAKGKERVVVFKLKPGARLIDVTQGAGRQLWEKFTSAQRTADYERFAEFFGADILKYPYGNTEAFVVKNSAALESAVGYFRKLMPFSRALAFAEQVRDLPGLQALMEMGEINHWTNTELDVLLGAVRLTEALADEIVEGVIAGGIKVTGSSMRVIQLLTEKYASPKAKESFEKNIEKIYFSKWEAMLEGDKGIDDVRKDPFFGSFGDRFIRQRLWPLTDRWFSNPDAGNISKIDKLLSSYFFGGTKDIFDANPGAFDPALLDRWAPAIMKISDESMVLHFTFFLNRYVRHDNPPFGEPMLEFFRHQLTHGALNTRSYLAKILFERELFLEPWVSEAIFHSDGLNLLHFYTSFILDRVTATSPVKKDFIEKITAAYEAELSKSKPDLRFILSTIQVSGYTNFRNAKIDEVISNLIDAANKSAYSNEEKAELYGYFEKITKMSKTSPFVAFGDRSIFDLHFLVKERPDLLDAHFVSSNPSPNGLTKLFDGNPVYLKLPQAPKWIDQLLGLYAGKWSDQMQYNHHTLARLKNEVRRLHPPSANTIPKTDMELAGELFQGVDSSDLTFKLETNLDRIRKNPLVLLPVINDGRDFQRTSLVIFFSAHLEEKFHPIVLYFVSKQNQDGIMSVVNFLFNSNAAISKNSAYYGLSRYFQDGKYTIRRRDGNYVKDISTIQSEIDQSFNVPNEKQLKKIYGQPAAASSKPGFFGGFFKSCADYLK